MTTLPKVAILGSPNVGKSTLFNRLLQKRRAITDATPGVTRDPVEAICDMNGTSLMLIDTGGYQDGSKDELGNAISELSLSTARKADIILLLVDANGLSPDDQSFIEKLRPYREKVILVGNKADGPTADPLVWNLYHLGFDGVVGVSAAHGRNVEALKEQILLRLAGYSGEADTKPQASLRIVILGKPNTGKSTLSNRLLNEEKSLVSVVPGTTRDVIEGTFAYRGHIFQVLDTAGIRRKSKVKNAVEYYSVNRALRAIKESDVAYLLIDAAEGLTEQDKKISSQIVKHGKGIVLVLSKWDLLAPIPNTLRAMKDRIAFQFPVLSFAPVIPLSAKTGFGVRKLLDTSLRIGKQLDLRISTSSLNQALRKWAVEYPVPSRGKNVKIRYGTQVSIRPTVFLFFTNRAKSLPPIYGRYLANRIRETFSLDMIPLRVEFAQR